MTYQIKDWDDHFENSASRKLVHMTWVPVPNKHDGSGYTRIMRTSDDKPRPDAAKIYSAWNLILQIASKCNPRGTLVNKDGNPINSAEMSLKTRAPKDWFDLAIPLLLEIGWLLGESPTIAAESPALVGRKGREQKGIEGKGTEGNNTACAVIPSHLTEVWGYFLEHRKAKKAPLTTQAIKLILKKLSPFSNDIQVKMLERSIENGWTGVFEIDINTTPKKSPLDIEGKDYRKGL